MSSGDHFVSSNAQDKNANHVRRPSNLSTIDNRNEKILNDKNTSDNSHNELNEPLLNNQNLNKNKGNEFDLENMSIEEAYSLAREFIKGELFYFL